jgi:hypothetical protein
MVFMDLTALSHSRTTNLALGKCSTTNFLVLYLGLRGPTGVGELYAALAAWRSLPYNAHGVPGKVNWLFNRVQGPISYAFNPSVRWPSSFFSGSHGEKLIYRVSRGVYALNSNGVSRYLKLLASVNPA